MWDGTIGAVCVRGTFGVFVVGGTFATPTSGTVLVVRSVLTRLYSDQVPHQMCSLKWECVSMQASGPGGRSVQSNAVLADLGSRSQGAEAGSWRDRSQDHSECSHSLRGKRRAIKIAKDMQCRIQYQRFVFVEKRKKCICVYRSVCMQMQAAKTPNATQS